MYVQKTKQQQNSTLLLALSNHIDHFLAVNPYNRSRYMVLLFLTNIYKPVGESHFNVSLIVNVRDKVTRQYPQATAFK